MKINLFLKGLRRLFESTCQPGGRGGLGTEALLLLANEEKPADSAQHLELKQLWLLVPIRSVRARRGSTRVTDRLGREKSCHLSPPPAFNISYSAPISVY